jgi:predicted nicotinamide N-methyase
MAKSNVMKPEWFKDKRVLDIGSFDGVLDIVISSKFAPKLLVGIDIDHHLTAKAM